MNNFFTGTRNWLIRFFYQSIFKPLAFRQDPETVHERMTGVGKFLGSNFITRIFTRMLFGYANPMLEQDILGIHFKNPIGLSAGFDKNAELTGIIPEVGFGFEEAGTITGEPCEGNPRPRLWRAKKSKSLVVYWGLMNNGSEKIAARLKDKKFRFPVGISIGKTNTESTVELTNGIADYLKAYRAFENIGAYYTINISCPNTFGGEPFTDPAKLDLLLAEINKLPHTKPILIKLDPDLSFEVIDQIIEVARKYKINGFVCSNLTKKRDNPKILDVVPEKGGLSGKVQQDLSDKQVEYIFKKCGKEFLIIGCGGVFTAEDAYRKIKLGASLIYLITGMIFEGPQVVSDINRGLVKLLKIDGYKNISEAIGSDN